MTKKLNKIYTKEDILFQLNQLNIPRGKVVLMHTSLRLIGNIEGGPKALLDILIEYFTKDGGLFCVPTHTWNNMENEITLDMNDSHTCIGAFSDIAAADPRGLRSQNPTHSMVVFGDRARAFEFIKDDESVMSPVAPEGCYGKLYRDGGYVLLVGVSHNKNTYLHCTEEMLKVPNRLSAKLYDVKVKLKSGEVIKRKMQAVETDFTTDISYRYPKYEMALRYHGAITDGFIGDAPTQCCDAVIIKKTLEKIWNNCDGTDPLFDEEAIPPRLYCGEL